MVDPVVINLSPHKKNIVYDLYPKPDLEEFVSGIVERLKGLRVNMPRIIIFCRRYMECAEMYTTFHELLGSEFTEPPGAPNIVEHRLVDMYTKCTEGSIKEVIAWLRSGPFDLRAI